MIERISTFFEKQAFGVCAWWGEKLGIHSSRIRLFFIYFSFLTVGSPLIIYMCMAFVLELRNYVKQGERNRIWDI
jgi:phage shock protein PspC (stress-responsive transcriptional regulator)